MQRYYILLETANNSLEFFSHSLYKVPYFCWNTERGCIASLSTMNTTSYLNVIVFSTSS